MKMATRKIVDVFDAIRFYNHPNDEVKIQAQDFLMDHFHWDLVQVYNEENWTDYKGDIADAHFIQRAADYLNYLFQKD